MEGDFLVSRGSPENGGGIIVRLTRRIDNVHVDIPGKVVDNDIVECDPPSFGEVGEVVEKKVKPTDMTASISVNGGAQFSNTVEVGTQEYEPDE